MIKTTWIQGKDQGSLKNNFNYYCSKIKDIKTSPDLVVLPELCLSNYFCIREEAHNFDLAIELNSSELKVFSDLAKAKKIVLVLPFFEKRAPGIYHNSCIVYDKDGSIAGLYRKMHIPDDPGFYEKYYFTQGDLGFEPIQTSIGKLGILICWDQWFPEAARLMSLKGAEILIYPTAIGWDDTEAKSVYESQLDAWVTIMRSHSIANNVFTIAVNRVGKEEHLDFWGSSFVADPYGKILHQNQQSEIISEANIDLSLIEESRRTWPFFRDRRSDQYQDLLKTWRD